MDQRKQQNSLLPSPGMRAAAFSVHVFTALGAGIALIALLEAVREHWAAMFGWLGTALIVDALDGPMARRLDVARVQPNWSGDVLDLRMGCLGERLSSVKALTDVFATADPGVVENAVGAASALPTLDRCADVAMLRAVVRPPDDPGKRAQVAVLNTGSHFGPR